MEVNHHCKIPLANFLSGNIDIIRKTKIFCPKNCFKNTDTCLLCNGVGKVYLNNNNIRSTCSACNGVGNVIQCSHCQNVGFLFNDVVLSVPCTHLSVNLPEKGDFNVKYMRYADLIIHFTIVCPHNYCFTQKNGQLDKVIANITLPVVYALEGGKFSHVPINMPDTMVTYRFNPVKTLNTKLFDKRNKIYFQVNWVTNNDVSNTSGKEILLEEC